MNEKDQFLQDTENILEQPITESEESTEETKGEEFPEETAEEAEQKLRNRREKRLAAKLQAERESAIALSARLEAITEASKTKETAHYLESAKRIYGNDTTENAMATDLLLSALEGVRTEAKNEALEAFRDEQRKERDAVKAEEASLDSMIDDIEDEYGVSLTKEQEKGFFRLLEKLSPKDRDGNVVAYADHHSVFEEYQERLKRPKDSRAKDLVSRSMTRSGSSADTKVDQSADEKFLKEAGII